MKKATSNAVAKVLMKAIKKEGTSWQEIRAAIEAEFQIANWLTQVRGVLQWLLNNGYIKRTENVHEEVYVALKPLES